MSKVSIWNGDTITRVEEYLDRHFDILEDIVRAIRDTELSEEYLRRKGIITLDATGAGVSTIQVPQGFDWILQRVTLSAAAAGNVSLYENTQAPSELLETVTLPANFTYSDGFNNNIYVPGGSSLLVVFTGGGANAQGTYNIQIQQLKRKSHTHAPVVVRTGDY